MEASVGETEPKRNSETPPPAMTPHALETYLHQHIPLSHAMGVRVIAASAEGIELGAPLPPNLNHRRTAFGGSVSALAILSAWAFLHLRLQQEGAAVSGAALVIQRNEVAYLRPIDADFTAVCPAPPAAVFSRFLATLARRGKARITLAATLRCGGEEAGTFSGDYVALRASK